MPSVNWSMSALLTLAPADMPRIGEVRPDAAVLAFTFALSLLTGLAIGIVPALAASKPALQSTLKASGRGSTAGRGQRRLRSALVVAEVALAVVLTLGAGLLLRSFLSVLAIDPGFHAGQPADAADCAAQQLPDADQRRALYATLFRRLDALPGVTASGGTTRLPLGSTNVTTKVGVEGRSLPPGEWPEVEFRRAVHNYFTAMGIPILRGRELQRDQTGRRRRRSSSSTRRWRGSCFRTRIRSAGACRSARRRPMAPPPWSTIVGVIGDVRHSGLEAPPAPEMYMPGTSRTRRRNPFIVVRTAGRSASSLADGRRARRCRPWTRTSPPTTSGRWRRCDRESVVAAALRPAARRRVRRARAGDGGGRASTA